MQLLKLENISSMVASLIALTLPAMAMDIGEQQIWSCENLGLENDTTGLSECIGRKAAKQSGKEAENAAGKGREAESRALKMADMGDQIGEDREHLLSELEQAKANADAATRAQTEDSLFERPYTPPKELLEPLRNLGLRTNRDLYSKGEKLQKQLYESAEELAAHAAEQTQNAERAILAANSFGKMESISRNRARGLNSIEGIVSAAGVAGVAKATSNSSEVASQKEKEASALVSNRETSKPLSPFGEIAESRLGERTEFGISSVHDFPARKRKRESLREKLKKQLAEAYRRSDAKEANAIAGKLAALENESRLDAAAQLTADDRVPASLAAFSSTLAAPVAYSGGSAIEADNEIGRIISEFESQQRNGSSENLAEVSLFERIKNSIRRCLSQSCLGS